MFFNEQNLNVLDESQELNFLFEDEEASLDILEREGDALSEAATVFMYESAIEYLEIENAGIYNEALAIQSGDKDRILAEESKVLDAIKNFFKKIWEWVKQHFNKFVSWVKSFGKKGLAYMQANKKDFESGLANGANATQIAANTIVSNIISKEGVVQNPVSLTGYKDIQDLADKLYKNSKNNSFKNSSKDTQEKIKKVKEDFIKLLNNSHSLPELRTADAVISAFKLALEYSLTATKELAGKLQMIAQYGSQLKAEDGTTDKESTKGLQAAAQSLLDCLKTVDAKYMALANALVGYFRKIAAYKKKEEK